MTRRTQLLLLFLNVGSNSGLGVLPLSSWVRRSLVDQLWSRPCLLDWSEGVIHINNAQGARAEEEVDTRAAAAAGGRWE